MSQPVGVTDPGSVVRDRPMTSLQMMAVAICVIINAIDGIDVLAMAFSAPALSKEWGLGPTTLGALFSAGLAGMAVGSVLLAPLADKIGRRQMIMASLAIIAVGMLASAFSQSAIQLGVLRFVTGLGIGAVLPSLNTVVAEYASNLRRDFCISMMTMGYSVGAVLGGIVTVYLIGAFGWRSVFIAGGVLPLLMLPIVAFQLPESIAFLTEKRPRNALEKLNHVLKRLGVPTVSSLPALPGKASAQRVGDLLRADLRRSTILTCLCFFLVMMSFYVLLSWTPKILVDLGLSTSSGISGSVVMNLTGIVGGLALGWGAARMGLQNVGRLHMVLCFFAVVAFGFVPHTKAFLISLAGVIGFLMNGAVVTLYALAPRAFPTGVRATGTGIALGFGRLGATVGPFTAGVLISQGWTQTSAFIALTVPMMLAAIVLPFCLRTWSETGVLRGAGH